MSRLTAFLSELRRRRVYHVAVVYASGAFVAAQTADIFLPRFGVPEWTITLLLAAAVLGFPVALVLGWVFDITPEGVRRTAAEVAPGRAAPAGATAPETGAPRVTATPRLLRRSSWAALALLLVATTAWALVRHNRDAERAGLDAGAVAVLPFRVSGADPQLAYLREGMVDLLAAKLDGAGGLRAVDSRALLAAWRRAIPSADADLAPRDAVELARSLGSGRVLLGEVVGAPGHLVVNASVLTVPVGRTAARTSVAGPMDSLSALVDGLAVRLVALEAGSDEHRLGSLTSTSLPALRAYLEGKSLYRRGRYGAALERFEQALEHDPDFALAALGLAQAGGWVDRDATQRGLAIAWAAQDRLGARDRALLVVLAGRRYPFPPSGVEVIEDARALQRLAPDQPEALYHLGDAVFHNGRYVGRDSPEEFAIRAFQEAVRLDSTYAAPMHHLIDLLAERGDTAAVRRLGRQYFALDSVGETADYLRWRIAAALGDEDALHAFWADVDSLAPATVGWISGAIQQAAVRLEDVERVLAAFDARGMPWGIVHLLRNRGRPNEAATLLERWARGSAQRSSVLDVTNVFNALFWDGDVARGERAARRLARAIEEPAPAEADARLHHFIALCAAERWRVWHGELETVDRTVERLRGASTPPDPPPAVEIARLCALELEATAAVQRRDPDAGRRVAVLDSVYRTGPDLDPFTSAGNLGLARLHEALGEPEAALAALRRRTRRDIAVPLALSTFLREEGRLAVLTGDSEGAIRAYTHYLTLRSDPEPGLEAEVEQIRAELARLVAR